MKNGIKTLYKSNWGTTVSHQHGSFWMKSDWQLNKLMVTVHGPTSPAPRPDTCSLKAGGKWLGNSWQMDSRQSGPSPRPHPLRSCALALCTIRCPPEEGKELWGWERISQREGRWAGGELDWHNRGLVFLRALSNGPGLTLLSPEKIESVYHSSRRDAASAAQRQGDLPPFLLITCSFASRGSYLCKVLLGGGKKRPSPCQPPCCLGLQALLWVLIHHVFSLIGGTERGLPAPLDLRGLYSKSHWRMAEPFFPVCRWNPSGFIGSLI